jgi:hypothetical protein
MLSSAVQRLQPTHNPVVLLFRDLLIRWLIMPVSRRRQEVKPFDLVFTGRQHTGNVLAFPFLVKFRRATDLIVRPASLHLVRKIHLLAMDRKSAKRSKEFPG